MRPRFLADEDIDRRIVVGVRRKEPSISFPTAQECGFGGRPDTEILRLALETGRILVSHDEKTMPAHFARMAESAGLIIVPQRVALCAAIEDILIVWAAGDAEELRNEILFLPLSR